MLAGGERVVLAVSGGADSVALLHLLGALAPTWRLSLHVVHVDHGLRPDAAADAAFVVDLAGRLGVAADVVRVQVASGGSLEAAARAARYAALEAAADRLGADRIAVGHTADDQAETVVMRLLEGAGPRGLAGIPPVRGRVIRPLLDCDRAMLMTELERAGLAWRDDPSNRQDRFLRNRIRHELLPRLDALEPGVRGALVRTASLARETVSAIDRLAAAELMRLSSASGGALQLPLDGLRCLPAPVGVEVLRQAAAGLGARAPLRAWAYRGLRRMLAAPAPRRAFRLGEVLVEVSGRWVWIGRVTPPRIPPREMVPPGRLPLPEIGLALETRVAAMHGYRLPRERDRVAFDADGVPSRIIVRARREGDRLAVFGGGTRRLKELLIDAKVPRWERGRVPVVEADGEILWLAGLRRSGIAPVTARTCRVLELGLVPLAGAPDAR